MISAQLRSNPAEEENKDNYGFNASMFSTGKKANRNIDYDRLQD